MKIYFIQLLLLASTLSFAGYGEQICEGDRVQFDRKYVGTVSEVFSNGKVKINSDSHSSYVYQRSSDVGKGLMCFGRICKGDRVQFDHKYVGTVSEVFSNGKVKIDSDYHSSYVYKQIKNVGKSYRCVEDLCEGDRVQFDGKYVGTVSEVFDNGKVKINSDSHSSYVYESLNDLGYGQYCNVGRSYQSCY